MLTVTFTPEELNMLVSLIDAALKSTGIASVKAAALIIEKLEKTAADAEGRTENSDKAV